MTTQGDPRDEAALRKRISEGTTPECPRCQATLRVTAVPPRSDIAYVRNRVLLECDSCGFKVALDRK